MRIKDLFFSKIDLKKRNLHEVLHDQFFSIDSITSNDLMIEDIIEKYDNCKTTCGSDLFEHWLKSIRNKRDVISIQKDMKRISEDGNKKIVSDILSKCAGKQKNGSYIRDLWNGFSIETWIIKHFYFLFIFNICINVALSFLTFSLIPKSFFIFLIVFFVVNFVLFILTNKYINHVTSSLGYLFSLIKTIKKINRRVKMDISIEIPDYKKFNKVQKYSVFFKEGIGGPGSGDIFSFFIDYFRIFFGMELFSFKRVERIILNNLDIIRKIYLYVGYIDCLINNLNIIEDRNCCYAEFIDGIEIAFEDMKHPLLEKTVGQNKKIDQSMIITGLNMSGKTTFMKSLGINQIMATSFGFCFAYKYKTDFYNVISSLCINDELLNGKSRYYAEAERLVEIKDLIENNKCLCLIDEILSGTNSEERIEGSVKILSKFCNNNSLIIAATHDTNIAEQLRDLYSPVYFDGEIKNDRIEFDYVIKDGIVSKKNGLLILKLLDI